MNPLTVMALMLKMLYGKEVMLDTIGGQVFIGRVVDYFFPEDNEHGKESIVLKTKDNDHIELTEETIEKIDIV